MKSLTADKILSDILADMSIDELENLRNQVIPRIIDFRKFYGHFQVNTCEIIKKNEIFT